MPCLLMRRVAQIVGVKPRFWVGNGFPAHRAIEPETLGRKMNPFILLDYVSPYEFEPASEKRGIGMHPHRGFETVTIAYQGQVSHRDSTGSGGTIEPGCVQWMTAGSGIEHEEMLGEEFNSQGGLFEMVQLWINVPTEHRWDDPTYQAIHSSSIPTTGNIAVICGTYQGVTGPASTKSPMTLLNVTVNGDETVDINYEWPTGVLVRRGPITVNGELVQEKEFAFLEPDDSIDLEGSGEVIVLSGEPLQPYETRGPMVMDTMKEVNQAFRDYKDGKIMKV